MTKTLQERFDEKYTPEPTSGCWLWTDSLDRAGYGNLRMLRLVKAHRVSWALHRGALPDGLHVLHKCDVPACVNPDHLFLGNQADNMIDMASKGRAQRGEKHHEAKLTEAHVLEVRRVYNNGGWTQADLATKFGVTRTLISRIVNRLIWKHV